MKNIRGLPLHLDRRRDMPRQPTSTEALLWERLRNKRLDGFKFRRQHPIGLYIADFYCHKARLVIEVDGSVHDTPQQRRKDKTRSKFITTLGNSIERFTNDEIIFDIESVLRKIRKALRDLSKRPSVSGDPLPTREGAGGGP